MASFASSYIPTTSATVTRSADVAQMTGTNFSSWYRQDEGTVCANATVISASGGTYKIIAEGADASSFKNFSLGVDNSSSTASFTSRINAGNFDVYAPNSSIASNTPFRLAGSYSGSSADLACNRLIASTKLSITQAISADRMLIGSRRDGSLYLNGTIARLAYYPKRLTNAQLQSLTA